MFECLYQIILTQGSWLMQQPKPVIYAIVEGALFHARGLCELLLSKDNYPDNVKLSEMLPRFTSAKLDELAEVWGDNRRGICMTINKRLMHPTTHRTEGYDWAPELETLRPIFKSIVAEVNAQRPPHAARTDPSVYH